MNSHYNSEQYNPYKNINPYHAPKTIMENHEHDEYDTTPFYRASGRIGRVRYLAYGMIYWLCFFPVVILALFLVMLGILVSYEFSMALSILMYILMVVAVMYSTVVLTIRRLNDLNRSGWYALLWVVPIIQVFFWFYLILAQGDAHVNDYGLPAKPPNVLLKITALALPVFLFVGTMAAVPAYQEYVIKTKIAHIERL